MLNSSNSTGVSPGSGSPGAGGACANGATATPVTSTTIARSAPWLRVTMLRSIRARGTLVSPVSPITRGHDDLAPHEVVTGAAEL